MLIGYKNYEIGFHISLFINVLIGLNGHYAFVFGLYTAGLSNSVYVGPIVL